MKPENRITSWDNLLFQQYIVEYTFIHWSSEENDQIYKQTVVTTLNRWSSQNRKSLQTNMFFSNIKSTSDATISRHRIAIFCSQQDTLIHYRHTQTENLVNVHLILAFRHHIQNFSRNYTDWLSAGEKHASQIRPWIFHASYNFHFVLEICFAFGTPRTIVIRIARRRDDLTHQFDHLSSVM